MIKRILFLLIFLSVEYSLHAQRLWLSYPYNEQIRRVKPDSALSMPRLDTTVVMAPEKDSIGEIRYRNTDNRPYVKTPIGWKGFVTTANALTLQEVTTAGNTTTTGITTGGRITSQFAGTQLRLASDGSNYWDFAINTSGSATFTGTGSAPTYTVTNQVYTPGGIATATAGGTVSNFFSFGSNTAGTGITTASYQFGGSSSIGIRAGFGGSGVSTMISGQSFANVEVAKTFWITGASSAHPVAASLAVLGLVKNSGTAGINNLCALYVNNTHNGAANSGGVNNYNAWFDTGNVKISDTLIVRQVRATGNVKFTNGLPGNGKIWTDTTGNGDGAWKTAVYNVLPIGIAADANYIIPDGTSIVILPVITADRTTTLPTLQTGQLITIHNRNSAAFAWSFTNGNVKDAAGATIANMVNQTVYQFYFDGTNLYKMN